MKEPYICCDRKTIECSICSTKSLYSPSGITDDFVIHFEPLVGIRSSANEKLNPIKSIKCKKCKKRTKKSKDPYFYY